MVNGKRRQYALCENTAAHDNYYCGNWITSSTPKGTLETVCSAKTSARIHYFCASWLTTLL